MMGFIPTLPANQPVPSTLANASQLPRIPIQPPNAASVYLRSVEDSLRKYVKKLRNRPRNLDTSPWIIQPPSAQAFQKIGNKAVSAFTQGVDTAVLQFRCPNGWDGVLNRIVLDFPSPGSGFIGGSGSIVWRVRVGNAYAIDLGNVLFTYGNLADPFTVPGVGIRVQSGQYVTMYVNVAVGSPVGGNGAQIVCAGFGWFYPRILRESVLARS